MCVFSSIIPREVFSLIMFAYSHVSSQLWGLGCTSSALRTPYEPSPPPPPPSDQHSHWVHSVWSRMRDMTWTCTTDTYVTLRVQATLFVPGLMPDVHVVLKCWFKQNLNRKLNVGQIFGFTTCYVWCDSLRYCNLCAVLAFSATASKTSILACSSANTTLLYLFLSTCPFISFCC